MIYLPSYRVINKDRALRSTGKAPFIELAQIINVALTGFAYTFIYILQCHQPFSAEITQNI